MNTGTLTRNSVQKRSLSTSPTPWWSCPNGAAITNKTTDETKEMMSIRRLTFTSVSFRQGGTYQNPPSQDAERRATLPRGLGLKRSGVWSNAGAGESAEA